MKLFSWLLIWNMALLINANDDCKLPAVTGPCRAAFIRWYYNYDKKECQQFTYGGCRGNANNFMSKEECEKKCQDEVCKRPAKSGPCKAAFKRWYFNYQEKECRQFIWGGCQSNGNNFISEDNCQENCDICSLPIVSGPCKAYMPRWAFDSQSGLCEQFIYGGCQGNANNFLTEQDCFNACDKTGCDYVDCSKTHCPAGIKKVKGCPSKKCQCNCPCKEKNCPNTAQECVLREDPNCKGKSCPMLAECDYKLCDMGELFMHPNCTYTEMKCPKGFTCKWSPVDWPHGCCPNDNCHAHPNSGCGKRKRMRWYYDFKKGRCFQFRFGGKGGNANKFKSEKKCLKACSN